MSLANPEFGQHEQSLPQFEQPDATVYEFRRVTPDIASTDPQPELYTGRNPIKWSGETTEDKREMMGKWLSYLVNGKQRP